MRLNFEYNKGLELTIDGDPYVFWQAGNCLTIEESGIIIATKQQAWELVAECYQCYSKTEQHIWVCNCLTISKKFNSENSVTTNGLCWAADLFPWAREMHSDIEREWNCGGWRYACSSETALLRAEWAERMAQYNE